MVSSNWRWFAEGLSGRLGKWWIMYCTKRHCESLVCSAKKMRAEMLLSPRDSKYSSTANARKRKELFRLNYIDNIWGSKWTRSEVGPWNRRQSLAIPKVCDQRFPGAVEMKIKIISMMVFLQFIEGIWEFSVLLYLVKVLLLRNGMSMCTECMCECFN